MSNLRYFSDGRPRCFVPDRLWVKSCLWSASRDHDSSGGVTEGGLVDDGTRPPRHLETMALIYQQSCGGTAENFIPAKNKSFTPAPRCIFLQQKAASPVAERILRSHSTLIKPSHRL
jgi:hypothetical protein